MADIPSTGGGKIRSRRAASSRKPYSRASSQRKTLFSRVTDTFKNLLNPIAPKWLTNRLNHESHDQGSPVLQHNQDATRIHEDQPSTSSNHRETHSRSSFKRSSPAQPRPAAFTSRVSTSSVQYYVTPPDTPPVSQQEPTPSASTSLSLSGGGSSQRGGKEDLLKHLNTMSSKRVKMDSDSPMGSDSSFLRKEMKYLSANDNASVASSSGCSSSMQAREGTNTSANDEGSESQRNLWSSSMESLASSKTSLSRQQPTMSSHKRPRFNPAVFGMPALGSASTPDLNQSSFYNGPVQFGGANASGRSPHFATPYKIPSVTKVKVRHINHQRTPVRSSMSSTRNSRSELEESSATGMSSTAKKILQTLEKMSSPLNDARRIPMTRTPSSFMAERQKRRTIGGSSRLGMSLLQAPPTTGISSPSAARLRRRSHMPMNNSLLVKKQPQRQDRRDIDDSRDEPGPSGITVPVPDSKSLSVRGLPGPISSMTSSASMPKSKPPPASFANDAGGSGGGGKMKSQKRTSAHYSSARNVEEEEPEAPNLPSVPLPLSSMPSFNFGKSLMTSTPTIRPSEKKANQMETNKPEFNFASPLVKTTDAENGKAQSSASNTPKFQFSSPPTKTSSVGDEHETPKARPGGNFTSGSKTSTPSLMFAPDPKVVSAVKAAKRRSSPLAMPSNETESPQGGVAPPEAIKAGSVMDILGGKGTKSNSTSKLVSSDSSNLKQTDSSAVSKSSGTLKPLSALTSKNRGWNCETCFVPNDTDAEKCVACETPKLGSSATSAAKTLGSDLFGSGNSNNTAGNSKYSFGIQPKKDNTNQQSFGLNFKKPTGAWNCDTCFAQNDASSLNCEACQTPKPGASAGASVTSSSKQSEKVPEYKFGVSSKSAADSTTKPSGWGSLLKKSAGMWECEVCMVQNEEIRKTCEACESPRPGTKKELNTSFKFGGASAGIYKFGVSDDKASLTDSGAGKVESKKDESPKPDSTVSQTTADSSAPSKPTFQFGVPTAATLPTFGSKDAKPQSSVPTFGTKPTAPVDQSCSATEPEKPKPAGLFSFGAPKSSDSSAEPAKDKPSGPGFAFGAQQPSSEPTKDAKLSTFSFGAPAQTSSAASTSTPSASSTSTIPTFGSSTNPPLQTTQPSLGGFGGFKPSTQAPAKPEEQKPAATAPTFAFGQPKAESSGPAFQFTGASEPKKPAETSAPATNKPLFGMGQAAAQEPQKPTFSFGKQLDKPTTGFTGFGAGSAGADSSNKTSGFSGFGGATQQSSASATSQPEPAKPAFGGFSFGSTAPATTQSSGGVFGSTPFGANTSSSNSQPFGSSNSTSVQPSPFGQPSASQSTGMFGASSNPAPAFGTATSNGASSGLPKPSFAFGTPSNNEPTQSKAPAFGGFPFAANSEQNSTPAQSGFNFGASNNAPAFGGTPNKPPPAFNATPSAAPGGFQFGNSSANQSNGMFQFGASSNQPKPEQSSENKSGLFVFGGNNAASNNTQQPQSTGFNFGGSTAPSFNFTGSQPATPQSGFTGSAPNVNPFSATPSATPGGRRVVRQARRRLKK